MGYFLIGKFIATLFFLLLAVLPFIKRTKELIHNFLYDLDLEKSLLGVLTENREEQDKKRGFIQGVALTGCYLVYLCIAFILSAFTVILYPVVLILIIGGFIFKN